MNKRVRCWTFIGLISAAFITGGAGTDGGIGATPDYQGLVASPDRSDADRQLDERRKPEQLLAFSGVRPGRKVLDPMALP